MSGSDEVSEQSGLMSCSAAFNAMTTSLTPPTLDESVFQPQLFAGFMKYLVQMKANENLLFIKHATLFSMLKRPLKEKYLGAMKIIWTFLSDSSPSPVNVSAEVRNKLLPVIWRVDGIKLVNDEMFDDAIGEIKLLLAPMFSNWIETNEWQRVAFFHTPPPTVLVILRLPSLRSQFESFLKERLDEDQASHTAKVDCKIFQMCCTLFDLNEQLKTEKDPERKARHFIKGHKEEILSLPMMKNVEMPNLHHKKKHSDAGAALAQKEAVKDAHEGAQEGAVEGGEPGEITCVEFIVEALETLSEELMDHEGYEQFVEERKWKCLDVLKVSLQQSTDKDGFVEEPTLSGILHSPTYGPLIMESLKGTDKYSQMQFLIEAQDFYMRYSGKRRLTPQERKEMQSDARKIYEAHLAKSDLEIPKRVKSELMKIIHSPSGRLSPTLFQIAGAWLFNKISMSWIREVNSLRLYADHDFDNHSNAAIEMDVLFNATNITKNSLLAGENFNLVPHPDDILGNPNLMDSFHKFVPVTDFNNLCFMFMHCAKEITTAPPEAKVENCDKLLEMLKTIAKDIPDLAPLAEEVETNYVQDKIMFNPLAFAEPAFAVARMLMINYYKSWVSKCKAVYKTGGWQPVRNLTFVGGNAVPGTTWIPTLGVSADTPTSTTQPKRKWGLRKSRNSSGSSDTSPSPIAGKKSSSCRASCPPTKVVITPPKDEVLDSQREAVSDDEEARTVLPKKTLDKLLDSHNAAVVLPKNEPEIRLEIPTITDTLGSVHLRRLFFSSFLELRLGDEEIRLWNMLCMFHLAFSSLSDSEVSTRQNEIRDAAMKILDENPDIPDHDSLVKVIKDSAYDISSRFFFDAEAKLYGKFHRNYESFLSKNQWIRY